jgi:hypothetical protein
VRSFAKSLSSSDDQGDEQLGYIRPAVEVATKKQISKQLSMPGIAFIDSNVSARCCHLLQKDSDRTVYGNVITATVLEERTMAFSDLINETISQSCDG